MFDHLSIGVADIARSRAFYDAALAPLGLKRLSDSTNSLGYGADAIGLWVLAGPRPVPADSQSGLHICLSAPSRAAVDRFHAAALSSGGSEQVGRPASEPTTAPATTLPSSSIPTATASRPTARARRAWPLALRKR